MSANLSVVTKRSSVVLEDDKGNQQLLFRKLVKPADQGSMREKLKFGGGKGELFQKKKQFQRISK